MYDVTGDCKHALADQVAMAPSYNRSIPDPAYNPLFDYNSDGRVTLADQVLVGATFNTRCPTFVYDHTGQLAWIEGRTTLSGTGYGPYDRLYIGGVYEKALKTGEVTKYYSLPDRQAGLGGRRVAMTKGATLSYLASDHLGGTSLVMDAAGNATSRMRYHPYGQVWTQSAAPVTDKLFTGHTRLGARSGMYYAGARFYSADLGRFMSADSIVPRAGDPQALNRYAYVRGNPLRFSDPTGHCLADMDGPRGCGFDPVSSRPPVRRPPQRRPVPTAVCFVSLVCGTATATPQPTPFGVTEHHWSKWLIFSANGVEIEGGGSELGGIYPVSEGSYAVGITVNITRWRYLSRDTWPNTDVYVDINDANAEADYGAGIRAFQDDYELGDPFAENDFTQQFGFSDGWTYGNKGRSFIGAADRVAVTVTPYSVPNLLSGEYTAVFDLNHGQGRSNT